MKIILSPSKTADYQTIDAYTTSDMLFEKQTKKLVSSVRKLSKTTLSKALQVKGDLLQQTHQAYQNFHKSASYQAFPSFNGLVYKQLRTDRYTAIEYQYIAQHVRILDALYGVLLPHTGIKPYRLDMKAKLGINLYHYWSFDDLFTDEIVINLASKEFSTMLDVPMIDIEFYENQNGSLKSLATYSKMARGMMLDYMILHQITNIDDLKSFDREGYRFSSTDSTPNRFVFIR